MGVGVEIGSSKLGRCAGDLEEEEEIDLPMGQNIKRVSAGALDTLVMKHSMVVAALRFTHSAAHICSQSYETLGACQRASSLRALLNLSQSPDLPLPHGLAPSKTMV